MIRYSYNYIDFDTIFFIGPLGIGNSDNISPKKKSIDADITHSSINTVKSDVNSIFASNSSDGDNEMSSSSDAVVIRTDMTGYQSKNSTSRLSKIPVPGATGASKRDGLRRVNSMGGSSRSAPSSGHSTPVPPETRSEQSKVVHRNKAERLAVGINEDSSRNRLSLNEQTFRSLPSSASSSPSNKRRNGSISSPTSSNSLAVGVAKGLQQNTANKKTLNSHPVITKTSSATTPEEIRKAKEREKLKNVTRLSKPLGSKQKCGTKKNIPVPSSSRSHSQCSSRSESPIEQNVYTSGARRSTMPSKLAAPKQVTKETNALAKLASRITQWAQRTQHDPDPKVIVKSKKSSAKSYRDIPVKRTPSPYDRTVAVPVRRSSFKLKGSRGSVGSTGSVSPIEPHLMPTGDITISNYTEKERESPFSDAETPFSPTTAPAGGIDTSSLESNTFMESSSSSYGGNTVATVIKKTPNRYSPHFVRTPGTKTTGELDQLIGELNLEEIEGAVSIEADEYRRMAQEVKALKTVLLKLKRELQADVSHLKSCF